MGRTSFTFKDCWAALTIVSSAGFYFFDIITTFMTARVYYYLDVNYRGQTVMGYKRAYKGYNGKFLSGWGDEFKGTFASIISIIVVSHTLNAVIFCLNAQIKREAMKAAYLLPLIHLRRLAILVWRTGTLQEWNDRVSDLKSAEFEAIYTILAATLETAPELLLQSHALVRLQHTTWSEPPFTTKLSFAAPFISAAYNCSQAIMYSTNKRNFTLRVGILATSAVYSASAILIRATGFVFMIELPVNFNRVYALVAILVPQTITYWWDVNHLENRASILKRLFLSSSFICMRIGFGPLYTLTSTEKKYRNRKWVYWGRILGLSFAHMIPAMLLFLYVKTFPYKQHVYVGGNWTNALLAGC